MLYLPMQHTVDKGHIQSAAHHVRQQVVLPLLVAAGVEGRQRVKGHALSGAQRPQDRIGDARRVKDAVDVAAVHVSAAAEGRHLLPAASHVDLIPLVGQAVPAVDGNVLRLAARITGSRLDVLDAKNRKIFRSWMAAAMSQERPGAYNQALMDLGATVCLPSGAPLCGDCPAGDFCIARQEGCQARLPVRSPKREKRTEHLTVFLLRRGAAAALRQRPDTGLLAGLWEYPHVPGALTEVEAARQLQMWGVNPTKWTKKLSARHIFTHVRWEMTGYVVEVDGLGPGDSLWAEAQQRERLAIPSAFEKFTAELKEGE